MRPDLCLWPHCLWDIDILARIPATIGTEKKDLKDSVIKYLHKEILLDYINDPERITLALRNRTLTAAHSSIHQGFNFGWRGQRGTSSVCGSCWEKGSGRATRNCCNIIICPMP